MGLVWCGIECNSRGEKEGTYRIRGNISEYCDAVVDAVDKGNFHCIEVRIFDVEDSEEVILDSVKEFSKIKNGLEYCTFKGIWGNGADDFECKISINYSTGVLVITAEMQSEVRLIAESLELAINKERVELEGIGWSELEGKLQEEAGIKSFYRIKGSEGGLLKPIRIENLYSGKVRGLYSLGRRCGYMWVKNLPIVICNRIQVTFEGDDKRVTVHSFDELTLYKGISSCVFEGYTLDKKDIAIVINMVTGVLCVLGERYRVVNEVVEGIEECLKSIEEDEEFGGNRGEELYWRGYHAATNKLVEALRNKGIECDNSNSLEELLKLI